jgi:hypothetical protein
VNAVGSITPVLIRCDLGKRKLSCWDAQCRHRVELQNEEAFLADIADWLTALVPPSILYILDDDDIIPLPSNTLTSDGQIKFHTIN